MSTNTEDYPAFEIRSEDYSASHPPTIPAVKLPLHRFEMKIPIDLWDAMNRAKPATSPMATWVKDVITRAIEVSDDSANQIVLSGSITPQAGQQISSRQVTPGMLIQKTDGTWEIVSDQHTPTIQKDGEWGID